MTEPEPEPQSLGEKAGEVESYGGIPMSDEELGEAWTGSEAGATSDPTTTTDPEAGGSDAD